MRRFTAMLVLTGAALLFAVRFTPPPSGVVIADDLEPYQPPPTTTTTMSPGVTAPRLPDPPTTTTLPWPPGVQVIAGPEIVMNRGRIQATITVYAGVLTNVEMTRFPLNDRRARQISLDAAPILEREAVATQSADIHIVSGATETSYAYIRSLREALREAGIGE